MSFKIVTLVNRKITAGKLVKVEQFYIGDEMEQPVSGKMHSDMAAAEAELNGLGHFSEALEFAKAAFPAISEKAQKGKANVVADYLAWIEAGRPVKTVEEEAAVEEAEEVTADLSEEVDF